MVYGANMRISNISYIIYCVYRYIFISIWLMWGKEAHSILVKVSTQPRPPEHITQNYFRKLMQSFAYLMPIMQDQEKVDVDGE